jgi:hypothetical protein
LIGKRASSLLHENQHDDHCHDHDNDDITNPKKWSHPNLQNFALPEYRADHDVAARATAVTANSTFDIFKMYRKSLFQVFISYYHNNTILLGFLSQLLAYHDLQQSQQPFVLSQIAP